MGGGLRVWMEAGTGARVGRELGAVEASNGSEPAAVRKQPADAALAVAPGAEMAPHESVESILAVEGWEQLERLALFMPQAAPADLERLFLALDDEKERPLDSLIGSTVFLGWMTIDPEGGLAFARKHQEEDAAWWAWGKTDPGAAVAAALASKNRGLGSEVVASIGESDPALARKLLAEHPQWRSDWALDALASGLMRTDPAAGASLVAASQYSIDSDGLISSWARRDPEKALAWAQALPDQERRAEALGVLIEQWAKTDPDRVAAAVTSLPDGRTKWQAYASHAARLAAVDPAAALAWTEAAPTEGLRRQATLEAARGLASRDAAGALDILRGLDWSSSFETSALRVRRPDGTEESDGYSASLAIAEIAVAAPQAAMAFVAELPPGTEIQSLASEAFSTWVKHDAAAASEWLTGQPAGEVKESATEALIDYLRSGPERDFDAALRWAETLPGESAEGYIEQVLLDWHSEDEAAARAALDRLEGRPSLWRDHLRWRLSQPPSGLRFGRD